MEKKKQFSNKPMNKKELVKKQVRKWVRRAGIWMYLKYQTGKQHIQRIQMERSHDSVRIHSAHVCLYSNVTKTIMYTLDVTNNFTMNWQQRGMYMRSPYDAKVDGVFMKWRPENTLTGGGLLNTSLPHPLSHINPVTHSVWLKIEYGYFVGEDEDKTYAAVYMIIPSAHIHTQYHYFPPYSISSIERSTMSGNHWTGPSISPKHPLSVYHRWPETWMRAETASLLDAGKKTT